MKKGVYFTFTFKSLFGAFLTLCLTVSFISMLFYTSKVKENESLSVSITENDTYPLIIVDAGHGGEDGGTSSSQGVREKDINLQISDKLSMLMNLAGYKTLLTRTEDKLLYDGEPDTMRSKKLADIRKRMEIINSNPESIFLSIHQNFFTESKYWGTQVFYSGNNPESKLIAEEIQRSVVGSFQKDNTRKIKQSGKEIYLLHNAKSPAVMVECGFMSNPSEALLLSDEKYQINMAVAIIDGVNNYLKY